LLATAYAPIGIVIGFRAGPGLVATVAIIAGAVGVALWTWFLRRLVVAQPREARVADLQPVDAEVTGYIVSYLLPVVAAANADSGDLLAYATCAALILLVAYAADLGAVNPIVYLFSLRVARGQLDGAPVLLLIKEWPAGERVLVTRGAGVVCLISEA
jgi:hypothetical protein